IVAIEQVNDVSASPWLKNLLPCDIKEIQHLPRHTGLQEWLQSPTWPTLVHVPDELSGAEKEAFKRRYGLDGIRAPNPGNRYPGNRAVPEAAATPEKPFVTLPDDFAFEAAELQVAVGAVRDGRIVVAARNTNGDVPLVITASRGLGRVTLLSFSPEREPVRSWKNLPIFWARLTDVPGD